MWSFAQYVLLSLFGVIETSKISPPTVNVVFFSRMSIEKTKDDSGVATAAEMCEWVTKPGDETGDGAGDSINAGDDAHQKALKRRILWKIDLR